MQFRHVILVNTSSNAFLFEEISGFTKGDFRLSSHEVTRNNTPILIILITDLFNQKYFEYLFVSH